MAFKIAYYLKAILNTFPLKKHCFKSCLFLILSLLFNSSLIFNLLFLLIPNLTYLIYLEFPLIIFYLVPLICHYFNHFPHSPSTIEIEI